MRDNRYFIDTNVFMYSRGKSHNYKESCANLILKIADGSFEEKLGVPFLDTEVFQEIFYRYAGLNKIKTAIDISCNLMELGINILPVRDMEVKKLIELYKKYNQFKFSTRDLIHLSVMVNNGIKNIISTDKHFDSFDEIKRIDPLDLHI